jgi:transposase
MEQFSKYVGLDVHMDTIAVSIADAGRSKARYYGTIKNTQAAVSSLLKKINPAGEVLELCYEAGPCGYGLYHQLKACGHECQVVAPSLIPKRASDKINTDRRDSLRLSELLRAGELTPVWIPDAEQEAIRDLVRTRDDFKTSQRQVRQQLLGFLLRHSQRWTGGKKNWTKGFWHWLDALEMPSRHQQFALKEYIDAVRNYGAQLQEIEKQMLVAKQGWKLEPIVDGLMAMRGINLVTSMGIVAELGDLSRFRKPRQLMAYLGLVPSEHSSGESRHQGGITKTGNGHVRRLLIESAWCYRFSARKSPAIKIRAQRTSAEVQGIAWKAQKRLNARYKALSERGLSSCKELLRLWRVSSPALSGLWFNKHEMNNLPLRRSILVLR